MRRNTKTKGVCYGISNAVPGVGSSISNRYSQGRARGRAAEQGIIFRIPSPGQGIIFVKVGSMTGSIFCHFHFLLRKVILGYLHSDFPAAPPRLFIDQVPSPAGRS